MSYKSFKDKIIEHLTKSYNDKSNWGTYKGKRYGHIMNVADGEKKIDVIKRIIEVDGVNPDKFIKPHLYANHLNSSQVVCYEFFRPLIDDDENFLKLFEIMNIPSENFRGFKTAEFEKEFKDEDGTNFDFFLSNNGNNLYIEVKYTEYGFAKCKNDDSHKKKFEDIYKKPIEDSRCIKDDKKQNIIFAEMQKYYQLFRNTLKIKGDNDYVLFLFPKENTIAKAQFDDFSKTYLSKEGMQRVKCLYWEDLTSLMSKSFKNKFFFYV